jgi:hypothetical protein
MSEPFDIKKAVDMSPEAIGKSFSVFLKVAVVLGLIFCIGYTVWSLFRPKQVQTQTVGHVTAESGSTVIMQQQTGGKKKPWFIPSPYVRIYYFERSDGRNGLGSEFGGEWRG